MLAHAGQNIGRKRASAWKRHTVRDLRNARMGGGDANESGYVFGIRSVTNVARTSSRGKRIQRLVRRGFEDGLGRRYRPAARLDSDTPLEILCFRHEITAVPAFEFALRERIARLSDFHHPSFARIRKVDRLNDERGTVTLMADGAAGDRLIEILPDVERTGLVLDVHSALSLVRQLLSARPRRCTSMHASRMAPLHPSVCSSRRVGACSSSNTRWAPRSNNSSIRANDTGKNCASRCPMNGGLPRFDERADLTQVGMVALSLLLARPLHDDEYPQQIRGPGASVRARDATARASRCRQRCAIG